MEKVILWLKKRPEQTDQQLIGPKATSLCTLHRLGVKVPPCFFLTTTAFRAHLDANGLGPQITARLNKTPEAPEEIRRIIDQAPLTGPLREQIATAYNQLGAAVVVVRSSATAEDLPGHSFAGQYETILGVKSLEECLDATRKCWASLWTQRAFEYRRRNGIDHQQVEMAVIVQQQIEPEAAGVAFSVDPVAGSRSRIVIESCRGLGEALVSGQVQPDRTVLRKKTLELIRQNLVAEEPSLDLKSARRLGRYVRRIEKRLGCPQDIEWAFRAGTLWFLQARPITAIPAPKPWEDRQVWANPNVSEVFPEVVTPLTYSVILLMFQPLFSSVFRLFGADLRHSSVIGLVAGRIYWNANLGLAAARPFVSPVRAARLNSLFGGEQNRRFERGEFDICDEDLPDLGFTWPRYIASWPGIIRNLIALRSSQGDAFMADLKAVNDLLTRFDGGAATTEELLRMVRQELHASMKKCDLLCFWPGMLAAGVLQKACRDWVGDADPGLGYRLLTAQGGIADTEAGLDLWRLAVRAHEDQETETALLGDGTWESIHSGLVRTEHGRQFLVAWDEFMTTHGQHCHNELELFSPRWAETPDYILGLVQGYLRSLDRANPLEKQRLLAEERERLTEQCRRRLRNAIKRRLFNWSLRRTQKLTRDRENWKNEAVRFLAVFRRVFLELGERLRHQGVLANREDIFFLELSEVEPVAQGRADFDVMQRIAQRRAEYEWNKAQTPPAVVAGRYDPQKHVASKVDAHVKVLQGIAVSPGTITGKARVITHPNNGQHVEPGEILVAPVTNPAWTPYFLPAAGVVMDMGGVLSHGAIIAREYGLPAVVNVGPASRIIQTGQTIRVDGDRGTVTILDEEILNPKHQIRNIFQ
ncbi:MAG: PEP-utilizing enzyme [Planctomycetes bacterium]|nr:PEP-utilizing enzyme [Planctomycetota bacterium]